MRSRSFLTFAFTIVMGIFALATQAEEAKATTSNVQLVHIPGRPDCFLGATEQGDPGKGASIMKMKGRSGCTVPWHWHPATENVMMVSGNARVEVKDQKPVLLNAGSFVSVPSKHVMRFACVRECTLFVYTDGPFAIHYVDDAGNEILRTEALKHRWVRPVV